MAKTVRVRHPKPKQAENEQAMNDEVAVGQTESDAQSDEAFFSALEGMSSRQLKAVIDRATAIRTAKAEGEKKEFFDRVRAEAAELGISLDQIVPEPPNPARRARSKGKSQAEVKYRGPNEGDTWTGRGRLPNWLAAIEAEGRDRAEFLVDKPTD